MARVSDIREQLVEGGIRLLQARGLQALSVRNLAAEAGASSESLNRHHADLTVTGTATEDAEFAVSFEALLTAVRRMIHTGRIRGDDGESTIAGRLWSLTHGEALLEIAGFFGDEGHGMTQILAPLMIDALVGMGDDRNKANKSLAAAMARLS